MVSVNLCTWEMFKHYCPSLQMSVTAYSFLLRTSSHSYKQHLLKKHIRKKNWFWYKLCIIKEVIPKNLFWHLLAVTINNCHLMENREQCFNPDKLLLQLHTLTALIQSSFLSHWYAPMKHLKQEKQLFQESTQNMTTALQLTEWRYWPIKY